LPKVGQDPAEAERNLVQADGDQEALRRPEHLRGSMQTKDAGEPDRRERSKVDWRGHDPAQESASLKRSNAARR